MIDSYEVQSGLAFHDSELADTVVLVNDGVFYGNCREHPLVGVAGIRVVDHPHMIGLNDPPFLVSRAAGNDMRFVILWQFHGYTQRNQAEVSGLQSDIFCGTQIDPIANVCNSQRLNVCEVFDFNIHFVEDLLEVGRKLVYNGGVGMRRWLPGDFEYTRADHASLTRPPSVGEFAMEGKNQAPSIETQGEANERLASTMDILSIVERLAGVAADWVTILTFALLVSERIAKSKPKGTQAS